MPDADDAFRRLYTLPFYHGLRSKTDVEHDLKEKGDYLFRVIKGHTNEVVLSALVAGNPRYAHCPIQYNTKDKTWDIAIHRGKDNKKDESLKTVTVSFPTLDKLTNHYKSKILIRGTILKHPVRRPKWLLPTSCLRFDKEKDLLGQGNFCTVVKGRIKIKGRADVFVAIKMLRDIPAQCPIPKSMRQDLPPPTKDPNNESDESTEGMFREAKLMSRCRHRNVITFHGVACDHPPVMIVMEYCPGASLDVHLQREKDAIVEGERILFCFETARGMRYLHHHGFIHRDLAARNCLISSSGEIKIADFGLTQKINEGHCLNPDAMPIRWMAPETIARQPKYSTKSDIWSYGALVYEIFANGVKPFNDVEDFKKISKLIRKCQMPVLADKTPKGIKELVKKCWTEKPDHRPDFKDIVKQILSISKAEAKYKWPVAADCSTNRISGVVRVSTNMDTAEIDLENSVDDHNSESYTPPFSRATSEETLDKLSSEVANPHEKSSMKSTNRKPSAKYSRE